MRRLNLNYLLIFIPIAIGLYWSAAKPLLVFAITADDDCATLEDRL